MRLLVVVIGVLVFVLLGTSARAADEWVENFDSVRAWKGNNPNAPAKFHASDGVLTLIDPPGGKVTWGTSVYAITPELDLSKTPYFVGEVVEVTAGFRATLINAKTKEKIGGLVPTRRPGIVVCNVAEQLGWKQKTQVHVGLYASGTESRVRVDYVKFTGSLTAEEQVVYERAKKMRPSKPKPFHGMEELASRRGWWHAPYRIVDAGTGRLDRPWVEDFDTVERWYANNPRVAPKFSAENGILTLIDPPGGEVTWGTSIYGTSDVVDLDKNRYLIVRTPELTGKLGITLINRLTSERVNGLCATEKPGIFVEDLADRLGWRGRTSFTVGIYTSGTESYVKLDYIKIAGDLTPEERAALRSRPKRKDTTRPKSADSRPMFNGHGESGATYASERLVYRDSVTGNIVWRMTHHPDVDKVIYYDIPLWNADGSLIRWATRRGSARQWFMNADGSGLRGAEALERARAGGAFWSVREPNVLLYSKNVGNRSVIHNLNIDSGESEEVASLSEPGYGMMPPHPDERHFLVAKRSKKNNTSFFYLLGPDGLKRKFDFGRFVHRLRFTRSPDHDIFYNFDDPRTQWAMEDDGSDKTHLTNTAGHPDWTHDGKWFTSYEGGNIVCMRRDGSDKYVLVELHAEDTEGRRWTSAATRVT